MDARMGALEGAYKQVADRLNSMDSRIGALDAKIDNLGETLRARMDRQFMWIVGLIVGSGVGVIAMWLTTMQAIIGLAKTVH